MRARAVAIAVVCGGLALPATVVGQQPPPAVPAPSGDVCVADFEGEQALNAWGSTITRIEPEGGAPQGKFVGRWAGLAPKAGFMFPDPPKDCRTFAALAFRVRALPPTDGAQLQLYFASNRAYGGMNYAASFPLSAKGWQTLTVPLHQFQRVGDSSWAQIEGLCAAADGPLDGLAVEFDDVRLIRGTRGEASCDEAAEDRMARVFAGRQEKVLTLKTKHYIIYTDQKAAGEKFEKGLEKIYAFVTKQFGFWDRAEPLIAYLFMKKEDYHAFVIRNGVLDAQTARASAGVGCAEFYATFYQAPEASVVVHEATHQLVHALGKVGGGGSWFQEGWAVYSENAYFGRSAAKDFKTNFKIKDGHTPFGDLVGIPVLLSGRNAGRNYATAGALFDFLFTGPRKEKFQTLVEACRKGGRGDGAWARKVLEEIYGVPVETLEDECKAWALALK